LNEIVEKENFLFLYSNLTKLFKFNLRSLRTHNIGLILKSKINQPREIDNISIDWKNVQFWGDLIEHSLKIFDSLKNEEHSYVYSSLLKSLHCLRIIPDYGKFDKKSSHLFQNKLDQIVKFISEKFWKNKTPICSHQELKNIVFGFSLENPPSQYLGKIVEEKIIEYLEFNSESCHSRTLCSLMLMFAQIQRRINREFRFKRVFTQKSIKFLFNLMEQRIESLTPFDFIKFAKGLNFNFFILIANTILQELYFVELPEVSKKLEDKFFSMLENENTHWHLALTFHQVFIKDENALEKFVKYC
jgi:hypothetical protein